VGAVVGRSVGKTKTGRRGKKKGVRGVGGREWVLVKGGGRAGSGSIEDRGGE